MVLMIIISNSKIECVLQLATGVHVRVGEHGNQKARVLRVRYLYVPREKMQT